MRPYSPVEIEHIHTRNTGVRWQSSRPGLDRRRTRRDVYRSYVPNVRPMRSYSRLIDEGDQARPNFVKRPLPERVPLVRDEAYRKRGRSSSPAESDRRWRARSNPSIVVEEVD